MKQGDKIKIHYKGSLDDGEIFDSSEGKEPLEFTLGEGQVITGFENGVMDMEVGDEKTIKIPASQAYGEYNDAMSEKVPREMFPKDMPMEKGKALLLKSPDGQHFQVIMKDFDETTVTLDMNHPLAGKDLTFKLKLVSIN